MHDAADLDRAYCAQETLERRDVRHAQRFETLGAGGRDLPAACEVEDAFRAGERAHDEGVVQQAPFAHFHARPKNRRRAPGVAHEAPNGAALRAKRGDEVTPDEPGGARDDVH